MSDAGLQAQWTEIEAVTADGRFIVTIEDTTQSPLVDPRSLKSLIEILESTAMSLRQLDPKLKES